MKNIFRTVFSASTVGMLFEGGTFVSLSNLSGLNSNSSLSQLFSPSSSLPSFFNSIFTLALSAGAILAVLRLAYAGWLYMGAADMWGTKQKAKEAITDAIIGLLLLIGIWIILNQINPNLLNLNVLQDIQSSNTASQQAQLIQSGGTP